MKLSYLLKTDWRLQELVVAQSQNLKDGEALFTYQLMGAICFKVVRNRKKFRRLYRPFNPVFLTSTRLTELEQVEIIGQIIAEMNRETAVEHTVKFDRELSKN